MAHEKKLQKAATTFRKENSEKYLFYSRLINCMAEFIKTSGATEVTVGLTSYGKYYEHATQKGIIYKRTKKTFYSIS